MRAIEPEHAMRIARRIAYGLSRQRKCPELFEEFVSAGLVAYARFDYEPVRDRRPEGATAQRMQSAMKDFWRIHTKARWAWPPDMVPLDAVFNVGVTDEDRFSEIEAARDTVRAIYEQAGPRQRALMDWYLAHPDDQHQGHAAKELGVTASRVCQMLRELRCLAA